MSEDGENRCWPCTIANSIVGLIVAWVPMAAAIVRAGPELLAGTLVWGLFVTGYTVYRLLERGYLPGAETAAKRTGLHEWIGPDSNSDSDAQRGDE